MSHPDETIDADQAGPFMVRWVGGSWFIGSEEASQRIEDGAWLDAWLAANGPASRRDLTFGDSRSLRERFVLEHGSITD